MRPRIFSQIAEHYTRIKLERIEKSEERKRFNSSIHILQSLAAYPKFFEPIEREEAELRGNMKHDLVPGTMKGEYKRVTTHSGDHEERLEFFYQDDTATSINFYRDDAPLVSLRNNNHDKPDSPEWEIVNDELLITGKNIPHLKDRYSTVDTEINKFVGSMLYGQFPTSTQVEKKVNPKEYENILEKISKGRIIPPSIKHPPYILAKDKTEETLNAITVINYYGEEIETISKTDVGRKDVDGARKRKYLTYLKDIFLRRITPLTGLLAVGFVTAAFVSACANTIQTGVVTQNFVDNPLHGEAINDTEWSKMVELGVVDQFRNDVIDNIKNDQLLTPGSQELLYAYLATDASAGALRGMWQKIATPQELINKGLIVGQNNNIILQSRLVNGGFSVFDQTTNKYIKFIAADTPQGAYLRQAFPSWKKAWSSISMPEEMINQISIVGANPGEGILLDGREYVALSTPRAGFTTLETFYMQSVRAASVEVANIQITALLEDYYLNVLLQMNRQGVIQRDINWKNIMVENTSGVVRGIPIDLDGAAYMIDQNALAEWQYSQLVERAGRRGVILKPFSEFSTMHPEIFPQAPIAGELKNISIVIDGLPTKVIIPASYVEGLKGEELYVQIAKIQDSISKQYRRISQGGLMTFEIETVEGTRTLNIVKTTAIGDKLVGYGGKLAEVTKVLKNGVKLASDALLIMWLADEVGKITDPAYQVSFQSAVAFPDRVIENGRDGLTLFLGATFDRLIAVKRNLAAKATDVRNGNYPTIQGVFDINAAGLLRCMSEYGMNQNQIYEYLLKKADASFFPAPSDVQFVSPFPILIPGAQEPINAFFSAVTDENQNKLMVLWAQETDITGTPSLLPMATFTKQGEAGEWEYQVMAEKEWSLTMKLASGDMYNLNCKPTDGFDGRTFQMLCEANK